MRYLRGWGGGGGGAAEVDLTEVEDEAGDDEGGECPEEDGRFVPALFSVSMRK